MLIGPNYTAKKKHSRNSCAYFWIFFAQNIHAHHMHLKNMKFSLKKFFFTIDQTSPSTVDDDNKKKYKWSDKEKKGASSFPWFFFIPLLLFVLDVHYRYVLVERWGFSLPSSRKRLFVTVHFTVIIFRISSLYLHVFRLMREIFVVTIEHSVCMFGRNEDCFFKGSCVFSVISKRYETCFIDINHARKKSIRFMKIGKMQKLIIEKIIISMWKSHGRAGILASRPTFRLLHKFSKVYNFLFQDTK